NGVGEGNLTQATQYPGGSAANRVTQNWFDWRDREDATKSGVQASEDTTTHRPIVYYTLDNLGEVTMTQQFDGDGVTLTYSSGVPQPPAASLLRAETTGAFDEPGRADQDQTVSVNQTTRPGSATSLTPNTRPASP